jgi:hypothetical protein
MSLFMFQSSLSKVGQDPAIAELLLDHIYSLIALRFKEKIRIGRRRSREHVLAGANFWNIRQLCTPKT